MARAVQRFAAEMPSMVPMPELIRVAKGDSFEGRSLMRRMIIELPHTVYRDHLGSERGFIISERNARCYQWQGSSLLSIKMFLGARALYSVGNGTCVVDDSCYLVLNHNQPYDLLMQAAGPAESFCVFFEPGFAESVAHARTAATGLLLDDPYAPGTPLGFFQHTYPHDNHLTPTLLAMRAEILTSWPENDGLRTMRLEQHMHRVMERLLDVHANACAKAALLPARRAATRNELYRRAHRARDFMAANFNQPLSLADISRVAWLSPNHLIRVFRAVFGCTPVAYLAGLRLDRARNLIRDTDMSIAEVCEQVGFESLGTFSSRMRERFGKSPRQLRAARIPYAITPSQIAHETGEIGEVHPVGLQ